MTAAEILSAVGCPSLTPEFVEELLTTWHVTPEDALEVARIVEAWGEERNNRMTAVERRREITKRITDHLRTKRLPALVEVVCGADETPWECDGCGSMETGLAYATATINSLPISVCSEECLEAVAERETARIRCTYGCGKPTTADDRVPITNGGKPGFAHALCVGRATRALSGEVVAQMKARGFNVLPGGRS